MSFENPALRTATVYLHDLLHELLADGMKLHYERSILGCIFALTPLAPAHRCSWPWLWRPIGA